MNILKERKSNISLNVKIKPYPYLWKRLPFLKNFGGNSIYPFIFLREDFYKNLQSENPAIHSIGILEHELFHIERQKKHGLVWYIKYFLFPSFRFHEEFEAYVHQMKFLKKNKETLNLEKMAKFLSGPMYIWSNSYKKTKYLLEKAWEEI